MTTEEVQTQKDALYAQLDEKRISYDKRWGTRRLEMALSGEVLPEETPGQEENGEEQAPVLESQESEEPAPLASVPKSEKKKLTSEEVDLYNREWFYEHICGAGYCRVERKPVQNGIILDKAEFVRTYSKTDHGESYCELADTFVHKNNSKR